MNTPHRMRRVLARSACALLGAIAALPAAAAGQDGLLPVAEAFALQARRTAPDRVALHWTIAPDYYLYRDRIRVQPLDGGLGAASLRLPPGAPKRDAYFGDVEVYRGAAEAEVALSPGAAGELQVVVQGCHEVEPLVCYPPHAVRVRVDANGAAAVGARPDPAVPAAEPSTAAARDAGVAGVRIAGLLAMALLGGLLLNLMPCVLPVLSLKLLSLAGAGADPARARRGALAYTAGVLASFAALGLLAVAARRAGIGLGWGFQLQQPLFVAALACVMLALALSLSGAVVFATRLGGVGHGLASRGGLAGDFFTGVLAVVVASPCTAPFMGVALAAAFGLSATVALSVFLVLGLGLALPFLLAAFVPGFAARLPRPGAWMETLKQALAFPLYATVAWLAWVLSRQRGSEALAWLFAGLLIVAAALWASERLRYARHPGWRGAALAAVLLAAWPLWRIHALPPAAAPASPARVADGSVPFSADALDALRREGRPVFVNMTADWCITCKANERRLLDTAAFRDVLAGHGAVYVKGDWTRMDPAITRYLQGHGAVGVPLYVVYRPGDQGRVLSTVPTRAQVEAALRGDPS